MRRDACTKSDDGYGQSSNSRQLVERFGPAITGSNLQALDPWIEFPAGPARGLPALRDDPDLRQLSLTSAGSITCRRIWKKKIDGPPHVECLYHLTSLIHKHRLVLKVCLPRWKQAEGQFPDVPRIPNPRPPIPIPNPNPFVEQSGSAHRQRFVEHGELARAGSLRFDRNPFTGHPNIRGGFLARRIGQPSASQGLPDAAGISRIRGRRRCSRNALSPSFVEFDVHTDEILVNMGPSTPARTACSGWCSDRRRSRARGARRTSAICTAAQRRSARTSRRGVHPLHRPHGLPGRDEHESRLRAGGGKAPRLEVPEKAPPPRVLIAELNRIASHLVAAGTYGLDMGSFHALYLLFP